MPPKKRFCILRSFLSESTTHILAQEALDCHRANITVESSPIPDFADLNTSNKSLCLKLGIKCGEELGKVLPNAVELAHLAFSRAAIEFPDYEILTRIATISPPLTGLSLLYGEKASMSPHYDSPTQPGQQEEWLTMFSMGNTVVFRCDDESIHLKSGDAIVIDSMAVLHGVERIVNDGTTVGTRLGLPVGGRLGLLFWEARVDAELSLSSSPPPDLDGFSNIFGEDPTS